MHDASAPATARSFAPLKMASGREIRLEYEWVGAARTATNVVVFLHEGLGSVSMWRDFPSAFCDRHGFAGFVFSRHGYGRSTPKPPHERWGVDFMAEQANDVLPKLFAAVGIERPWLFGHSDGGTIALLFAARHPAAGVIAVAPHLFVEDVSIASIAKARAAYESGELRERLARHHADPDSAFRGWNDAWLAPAFRDWNIEQDIATIACPVLAVQGEDDEYGTIAQIRAIARRVPQAELLALADCGHSPHRDQRERLIDAAGAFIVARS
ncbi:MAG TPA: alpha/beta hydrolase [Caldimonas sp.]|jgi:pimeloyl-ACP methyl ester carboxylesterase|nr:alpha/beta hydrolase [Caldimonas sp.]